MRRETIEPERRSFLKRTVIGAPLAVAALSSLDIGLSEMAKGAATPEMLGEAPGMSPYSRPVQVHPIYHYAVEPEAEISLSDNSVKLNPNFITGHTVCLGCRSHCGIRVKIDKRTGRIVRIYGNPYDVHSATKPLPLSTPILDSFKVFSLNLFSAKKASDKTLAIPSYTPSTCAKGIAHLQVLYDPYRNLVPLKRAGPRGSGQWKPIPWEQLIEEVTKGGKLFGDIGEADDYWGFYDVAKGYVSPTELISDLYPDDPKAVLDGLGDSSVRKKLFAELKKKLETDPAFSSKYADRLIDPTNPEYGPKTNQIVFMGGRITEFRAAATQWFVVRGLGSENWMEHTNICELTYLTAHSLWSKYSQAPSNHYKADIRNAEFVIFWGTAPGNANFPMQTAQKFTAVTRSKEKFSYVTIDPVLQWSVSQPGGDAKWIPIKPGTDGALAMAMIRWIIDNERYNKDLLEIPNIDAAKANKETICTDATHLVITGPIDHPRYPDKLIPADLDLPDRGFVAVDNPSGEIKPASAITRGVLDYEGEVKLKDGTVVKIKTVFRLLKEASTLGEATLEGTLAKAEEITGVPVAMITWLADEFTSHGRRASVTFYRGPISHQNGITNSFALLALNTLIGNVNYKGGYVRFFNFANKAGPRYNVDAPPKARETWGVKISREPSRGRLSPKSFEETNEFTEKGYPARRPWFYFATDMWSEMLPSMAEGYPYQVKILILHMANPLYSIPAHFRKDLVTKLKEMKPEGKKTLIVKSDTVIDETTAELADYVIPDGTYFEVWNINSVFGFAAPNRGDRVMWPVVEPMARDEKREYSTEQFLIDVTLKLKEMGLAIPGVGDQAIADKDGKLWPLRKREDFYLKAIANMVFNIEQVPDASQGDIEITAVDEVMRRHEDSLKAEEWPKVLFVLSRGAKVSDPYKLWDGQFARFRSEGLYRFYIEEVAKAKNSITGKRFRGMAGWYPAEFSAGGAVDEVDKEYPFKVVTYKPPIMTNSRSQNQYWILEVNPANWVEMNGGDARRLGIGDGDEIVVETREGKRKAAVKVREGIQPGVLAFMSSYGHWQYGSKDYAIGGRVIKGDERRGTGVALNPIMRTDPTIKGAPFAPVDLVGGNVVFYETRAKVAKA